MALTHFAQAFTIHLIFCNLVLAAAPGILDSLKNTRSLHALHTASLVGNSARSQSAYHAEFFFLFIQAITTLCINKEEPTQSKTRALQRWANIDRFIHWRSRNTYEKMGNLDYTTLQLSKWHAPSTPSALSLGVSAWHCRYSKLHWQHAFILPSCVLYQFATWYICCNDWKGQSCPEACYLHRKLQT